MAHGDTGQLEINSLIIKEMPGIVRYTKRTGNHRPGLRFREGCWEINCTSPAAVIVPLSNNACTFIQTKIENKSHV